MNKLIVLPKYTRVYKDAIQQKYHNKKVTIVKMNDTFLIEVLNCIGKDCNDSIVFHAHFKNKVRVSAIYVSKETLSAIVTIGLDILCNDVI